MADNLLPEIAEYCKKFETGAYASKVEEYLHFAYGMIDKFQLLMQGRDNKISTLLRENQELRSKLK